MDWKSMAISLLRKNSKMSSSPCNSCFFPVDHSSYFCHSCFEPVPEKMAQMDQNYQNAKMAQIAHSTPKKTETSKTVHSESVSTQQSGDNDETSKPVRSVSVSTDSVSTQQSDDNNESVWKNASVEITNFLSAVQFEAETVTAFSHRILQLAYEAFPIQPSESLDVFRNFQKLVVGRFGLGLLDRQAGSHILSQKCDTMKSALQTYSDYCQAHSYLPNLGKFCSQCIPLLMTGLSSQCSSCHWSEMNLPSSQNLLTECITSSEKAEQSEYFRPEFKKMKYSWYRRRLAKSKPIQSLMDIETRVPPLSFGPLPHYVRGLKVSIDCSYVRHCSNMSGGGPGLVNQVKEVHKILDSQRSTRSPGQHSFMMLPKPPHSSFHQDGNQVAQQSLEQCKPLQTRV